MIHVAPAGAVLGVVAGAYDAGGNRVVINRASDPAHRRAKIVRRY